MRNGFSFSKIFSAGLGACFIGACSLGAGSLAQAFEVSPPASLEYGLLVETELNYESFDIADTTSDITVATAAFGVAAQLDDRVDAELFFLYEEDDTPLEVDVATLGYQIFPDVGITVGQYYLPFGVFESSLISDPLTLELGEIRESALQVDFTFQGFDIGFYIFNGELNERKDGSPKENAELDNFGFSVSWGMESSGFELYLQADYLNNFGDTDTIQDTFPNGVASYEGGVNLFGQLNVTDLTFIAEYTAALDVMEASVYGSDEPSAANFEVSYSLGDKYVGFSYQVTDEAGRIGLPEDRVSLVYGSPLAEYLSFTVEFGATSDYSLVEGGFGDDSNYLIAQLALEI